KDYYTAETDFWKVVKGILREREKSEFDRALRSVDDSLALLDPKAVKKPSGEEAELAAFYRQRMGAMQSFFRSLDKVVAALMAFDNLRAGTFRKLKVRVNSPYFKETEK
ncbi:MAG: hypothetical protein KGN80_08895, partial [Acidobacteriota bacterium]|nr:hypothetical protein [Acidobacteriota bacterium]